MTFLWTFPFKRFASGQRGRNLWNDQRIMVLFKEIARYYYTEESTRFLANRLLKTYDNTFVERSLEGGVDWSEIAREVLTLWQGRNRPNSTILLLAMKKSNQKAANVFREALMKGEYTLFLTFFPLEHNFEILFPPLGEAKTQLFFLKKGWFKHL